MKTRTLLLSALPLFIAATSGCLDGPTCANDDEVFVHDDSRGGGVCMRLSRAYPTSTTPAQDAGSSSHEATPAPTTTGAGASTGGTATTDPDASPPSGGSGGSGASGAAACGGHEAQGNSIRVVDKSDLPPALNDVPPNVADGTYELVQATFFRSGQAASPVRSLRAALEVQGPTLALSSQDTSVAGLPKESLSFLTGSGAVTKTCESAHGTVSSWFFPFGVGASAVTRMEYDGAAGVLRIVVARTDGATELVFAK
jgi:hypothetical protein